jgi:ankyrin repeat protein
MLLNSASSNSYIKVVKLLLERDTNVEAKNNVYRTLLLHTTKNRNKTIIKFLLATNRVDIDSKNYYNLILLSIASRIKHKDIIVFLLTKSYSLNIQDNFGRTIL